ncbi:hypothetical protein RHOSPDRAFT_23129 [Rhodotorula sp. JG-1b]|nr:hypothetical protein RHOSPDRAFT_23129 [Rhodotorula sp. JG-1b]
MNVPAAGGSSSNRYQAIPVHGDPPLYPPPPASAAFKNKGKGKGRAMPDDEEKQGLSFGIRFTDGQTPDLVDLWVGHRETVRDLKRRQVDSDPLTGTAGTETDSRPRRLRLIQLGRVLPDGVLVVPFTTQLNSRRAGAGGAGIATPAAPAAAAAAGPRAQSSSSSDSDSDHDSDDAQQEAPPVWLHCSVGEPMDDEELAAETLREAAAAAAGGQQLTPLQGFDRLREAGFSDQDIENLRSEFRAHAPPDRGRTVDDEEEHQRALEEQWMSGMTGLDEAAAGGGGSGHYYSLLKGVCAGFFVPFLPLFFFRTQVFSKRYVRRLCLPPSRSCAVPCRAVIWFWFRLGGIICDL